MPKRLTESLNKGLYTYATEREKEYLDAFFELGDTASSIKVAKKFGVTKDAVTKSIRALKKRASKHGWSPEHGLSHPVPEGFEVKGCSILYDKDGQQILTWVKSRKDIDDTYKQLFETLEVLTEEWTAKSITIPEPKGKFEDRLTIYPVVDPHVGMYAWALESGDDYDLKIAEQLLTNTMQRLVDSAPETKTALICNLGDFFHSDSDLNITARSGNKLDVDTRWALVVRTGLNLFIALIYMTLTKHEKVHVIIDIGNHDDYTSAMLSIALSAYFKSNPRVEIDQSPAKFHYYRFGKVLIGTTHGDTIKLKELSGIMATDRPKDWGQTEHRYFYTGHLHHKVVEEQLGCVVEVFNTIAPNYFYLASTGYRAKRNMVYIVMDKEHGEVERFTVDIGQVKP